MWHYLVPAAAAIPCFGVWTYVGSHQDFMGIKPIALYGFAYLGKPLGDLNDLWLTGRRQSRIDRTTRCSRL